ncbi:MFS transporter [Brevibacillus migulae]|uniref:MFS transporter n=1 Tax=Brevibacillus migulae TaxID=1644114 RepID=UPI00106E0004|nr:MFS transporter [Brevibacillus migulae]
MSQARPRLWSKDFIVVSSINFFLTLVFYLLLVTIAVYAVDVFQASTSQAGLVTGIFIIGTLIGRLFIGRMIDFIGRKKTLFIGLLCFTLTTLLYFVNFGITFLLVNRFLHGLTLGIASTATGTIVAQIIPAARKGEGIGYYSMSATLATAIGPFIGLYMSQHTSFQVIFGFCLILGIISFLTAFFVHVPAVEVSTRPTASSGLSISSYIEPKALPIAFVTLAIAFCYSGVLSFLNFYAKEVDLVNTASFFFIVYAVAVLASRPFTGRMLDQKGANYVMYPAFLLFAAGMFLLSVAGHSLTLLTAGILIGLGFGNMQSSTQAIAVKLTAPQRLGLATSTFFIFLDAGLGFGPYLLGFIIPVTGYRTLYVIMGVLILASALLYHVLHGKKDRASRTGMAVGA